MSMLMLLQNCLHSYEEVKGHKRSTTQPRAQVGSKSAGVMSPLKSSKVAANSSGSNNMSNTTSGSSLATKRHVSHRHSSPSGTTTSKRSVPLSRSTKLSLIR